MDYSVDHSRERDLECGETSIEVDEVQGIGKRVVCVNEAIMNGQGSSSRRKGLNSSEGFAMQIRIDNAREETGDFDCMEMEKEEKRKKWSSKKPPKPPRPPGGPSLAEADMKLVREICKVAKVRRATNERIKTLKKKRAEKASSSTNNILAMVITILFFLVIIFQGILGSRVR